MKKYINISKQAVIDNHEAGTNTPVIMVTIPEKHKIHYGHSCKIFDKDDNVVAEIVYDPNGNTKANGAAVWIETESKIALTINPMTEPIG